MISISCLNLTAGDTYNLTITFYPAHTTNRQITWTNDNPAVASVDHNGRVTAHKQGSAVLTANPAEGEDSKAKKCNVTVKAVALLSAALITDNPQIHLSPNPSRGNFQDEQEIEQTEDIQTDLFAITGLMSKHCCPCNRWKQASKPSLFSFSWIADSI